LVQEFTTHEHAAEGRSVIVMGIQRQGLIFQYCGMKLTHKGVFFQYLVWYVVLPLKRRSSTESNDVALQTYNVGIRQNEAVEA